MKRATESLILCVLVEDDTTERRRSEVGVRQPGQRLPQPARPGVAWPSWRAASYLRGHRAHEDVDTGTARARRPRRARPGHRGTAHLHRQAAYGARQAERGIGAAPAPTSHSLFVSALSIGTAALTAMRKPPPTAKLSFAEGTAMSNLPGVNTTSRNDLRKPQEVGPCRARH